MDRPAYGGQNNVYQDPGGYPAQVDPNAQDSYANVDPPQGDPQEAATGPVNDDEINQTLAPYGEWVEVEGYGRVWRPNATVVGVDFTPYETAGSWVDTDAGWSFSCDWDWGWLPFHYGYWDWFDDGYWGWVPGYTWGPAWVEWRYGGGYIGWRPLRPIIRDHRHHGGHNHDAHWRFAATSDFGKAHIHSHVYNNLAEGLRVTSAVQKLPLRGTPTRAASVMHGRPTLHGNTIRNQPAYHPTQPRTDAYGHPAVGVTRPAYRPNEQPTWQNNRTWRQPTQPPQWRQPAQQPRQPAQTWRQPTQPSQTWRQPTQPSSPAWHQPSQPGLSRPSSPPTYSPPSHSVPSHSYSPPSTPSHSSSSSSSSHSSSSSSSSSSGGSHHK
jgi:Family of unknown function (DUF6600)